METNGLFKQVWHEKRRLWGCLTARIKATSSRSLMENQIIPNRIVRSYPIRFAHQDLPMPDFSKYRRKSVQDPTEPAKSHWYNRKVISNLPLFGAFTAGVYSAKTVATNLVQSMAPSKDILAIAQAEVNISTIPVGTMMTVKWRGKPLFIKHRAEADIDTERKTPLSILRHPEKDEDRVIKPEWLIVIGICTHLGCVPISNAGDYNAFYCPCHGSHYDHSGRIRKGPAPTNLEVPPYTFLSDTTILVG